MVDLHRFTIAMAASGYCTGINKKINQFNLHTAFTGDAACYYQAKRIVDLLLETFCCILLSRCYQYPCYLSNIFR